MRPVARITRASLIRLGREMEERGVDEVDVHRLDLDSRWIVVLDPVTGSRVTMISREGGTPEEEAEAEAEAKRNGKVRK